MAKKCELAEITERLGIFAKRLNDIVGRATWLHSSFMSLNAFATSDGSEVKSLMGPLAGTFNAIQTSFLRESVLIVVRVLDRPRRLEGSDKVSFEVVSQWLRRDCVRLALIEKSQDRYGEKWARRNVYLTKRAIHRIQSRMQRLSFENPNRGRLLRNFRDDFLAHELHHEVPRNLPELGHLDGMINEIQALSFDTLFACTGYEIGFNHIEAEAREGAEQLWRAICERQFDWHPKLGLVEK